MASWLITFTLLGVAGFAVGSGDLSKADWTSRPWLGRWRSTEHRENWDAFSAKLGLAKSFGDHADNVAHTFWSDGEHFHHHLSVPARNFEKTIEFKFGQPFDLDNNGTIVNFVYAEHGEKLYVIVKIPSLSKEIHDTYYVKGNELVKTYKLGDVVAQRWFTKEAIPNTI